METLSFIYHTSFPNDKISDLPFTQMTRVLPSLELMTEKGGIKQLKKGKISDQVNETLNCLRLSKDIYLCHKGSNLWLETSYSDSWVTVESLFHQLSVLSDPQKRLLIFK